MALLEFDTDFLKGKTEKKSVIHLGASSTSTGTRATWKHYLMGGGVILGVILVLVAIESSDSTSSSSSPATSNYQIPSTGNTPDSGSDLVTVGRFRCSSYNASRADALTPSPSETQMEAESNALDSRIAALKAESNRIDNMYVDEYDQDSVDNYNYQVNNYNSKKSRLESEIAAWNNKQTNYNNQVDVYNAYLDNNCTPAY